MAKKYFPTLNIDYVHHGEAPGQIVTSLSSQCPLNVSTHLNGDFQVVLLDVGDVHLGSGGHRLLFRSASRDEEHLELYYLSQPGIPSLLFPSPDAALSGSEKCYLLCPINLPRCERGWRRGKNVTNGRTEGRRAVSTRRASDQLRTASTCRPAPATAKARPRSPPPRGSAATMSSTHSLNVH